ncbi:MAG: hypothetical protein JXM74_05550 [Fusobacteriaceae bacterium]|nr:hypothetical protein [Fusobacteriaceae bacterium]MBN2838203.1 hypothetical protein [Fusobacteriaceae bacterium]
MEVLQVSENQNHILLAVILTNSPETILPIIILINGLLYFKFTPYIAGAVMLNNAVIPVGLASCFKSLPFAFNDTASAVALSTIFEASIVGRTTA